jgi:hypothetical protein
MLVPFSASAISVAAVDFTSPTTDFTNDAWSLGFQFTTNKILTVTDLGFYDDLKNDLTESHDVGIYNSLGSLLVSGTVNPGDTLDGWFRYVSVAPTTLQAGQTYFAAATTGSENYTWNPNGFIVNPDINFIGAAYQSSTTLVFPGSGPDGNNGYFGANFKSVPIPEPLTILGTGLALGFGGLFKKQQSKRKNSLNQQI